MHRTCGPLVLILALPLTGGAASAQSGSGSGSDLASSAARTLTDPAAIGDAAQKAADELGSKAKDKVLASAMLGREVTGPGGDTIGKVQDLVVVPGGKIVAILVKPGEGEPVALPYQALKVSAASSGAEKLGLSLPVGLKDARGIRGMQALTEAVTSGTPGSTGGGG